MKNYVIIGGSIASVGCIEGIRSADKEGKIIMLCKEKVPAYCRPLISYYLQKKTDFQKMKYRSDKFYQENNVELIYEECKKIDITNKTVCTEKGLFPYDRFGGTRPAVQGPETVPEGRRYGSPGSAQGREEAPRGSHGSIRKGRHPEIFRQGSGRRKQEEGDERT